LSRNYFIFVLVKPNTPRETAIFTQHHRVSVYHAIQLKCEYCCKNHCWHCTYGYNANENTQN